MNGYIKLINICVNFHIVIFFEVRTFKIYPFSYDALSWAYSFCVTEVLCHLANISPVSRPSGICL